MFRQQVIFEVGGQLYGLDSMKVTAVEAGVDIHPLPGVPDCIAGFAQLRGEYVPVCDLYRKLNLRGSLAAQPQVIYVSTTEGNIGCLVDAVTEIGAVAEDVQMDLPGIIRMDTTGYVGGIIRHNGNLITVIDQNSLLTPDEKTAVFQAVKKENTKREKQEKAKLAAEAKKKAEEIKKAAEEAKAAEAGK